MEREYSKNIARKFISMYKAKKLVYSVAIEIFNEYQQLKQLEIDLRSDLSEYDMDRFYRYYNKTRTIVVLLAKECKKREELEHKRSIDHYDWIIDDF